MRSLETSRCGGLVSVPFSTIQALVLTVAASLCLAQRGMNHRIGDGGPATRAQINAPTSISLDLNGNLYVYQAYDGAVRRIDAVSHIITTVVEECNPAWEKPRPAGCVGPASEVRADAAGSLFLAEFTYNILERFDLSARTLSRVAGTGDLRSNGDGRAATEAGVSVSYCFTWDQDGNLIVCDSGYVIRRIDAKSGVITRVAGSGRRGFGGDKGPALDAQFTIPLSVAVDRSNNIYFTDDTSNRIRRIDGATGTIDTVAGTGSSTTGPFSVVEFCCEGALATRARFTSPRSLAFDRNGDLLFVVSGRVCRIDKDGNLRTIAGIGKDGFGGDGGPATSAHIGPVAIAVDEGGNVFIAEYENNRIRRVDARSGIIRTVGGNGLPKRPPPTTM